jgi:putative endonuclease
MEPAEETPQDRVQARVARGERRDRRRAIGALGERHAAAHLERLGYEIVERNFRTRSGELDIVATSDRSLVFCEVKTRIAGSALGPAGPLDAIGAAKRGKLRRLAREWLDPSRSGERPHRDELRFDAIGVTVNRAGGLLALEHVEAAF